MGLLFIDGFDHYVTAGIESKWTNNSGCSISAGNGRFGTAGLYCSDDEYFMWRNVGQQLTTIYIGAAIKITSITSGLYLFPVHDGLAEQCTLNVHSDGYVYGMRGGYVVGATQIGGPSTAPIPMNEWHYVEVKYVIDNSVGVIEVHLDGVQILNLTGVDNQYSATLNYVSRVYTNRAGGHPYIFYMDDFYIADDGFQGDCRVETRFPSGDGNYEQWTKSGGSHNYENIDETPPVTTDYISSATVDQIDTYTKSALTSTAGTIKGVAVNMYCQKAGSGSRQIAGMARLSGTDLAGSSITPPSGWSNVQQFLSRPGGGSWSVADVNSAEFGVKLVS